MSYTPIRDTPIGAGTWLVVGGAILGFGLLLFKTERALESAFSTFVIRAPGRLVQMPGGSTPENRAMVVAAFGPGVQDMGNGIYSVAVATDTTGHLTTGAKVL